MMEIWKDIKGYEGLYQVSNMGRVKSINRETIREHVCNFHNKSKTSTITYKYPEVIRKLGNNKGYLHINLCKENKRRTFRVHRLVAEAFIENHIMERDQVNHKNGIKTDNRVYNLEWCTAKENNTHALKTGLKVNFKAKYKVFNIQTKTEFESAFKAAEWLNETKFNNTRLVKRLAHSISRCCKGNRNIAYGYNWEYINYSSTTSAKHVEFK